MLEDFLTRPWLTSLLPKGSCRNFNKRLLFLIISIVTLKIRNFPLSKNQVMLFWKFRKFLWNWFSQISFIPMNCCRMESSHFIIKCWLYFLITFSYIFLSNICNISQLHLSNFVIKFKRSSEFVSAIKFHPYNSNCLGWECSCVLMPLWLLTRLSLSWWSAPFGFKLCLKDCPVKSFLQGVTNLNRLLYYIATGKSKLDFFSLSWAKISTENL